MNWVLEMLCAFQIIRKVLHIIYKYTVDLDSEEVEKYKAG